jgi:hypothetical protein
MDARERARTCARADELPTTFQAYTTPKLVGSHCCAARWSGSVRPGLRPRLNRLSVGLNALTVSTDLKPNVGQVWTRPLRRKDLSRSFKSDDKKPRGGATRRKAAFLLDHHTRPPRGITRQVSNAWPVLVACRLKGGINLQQEGRRRRKTAVVGEKSRNNGEGDAGRAGDVIKQGAAARPCVSGARDVHQSIVQGRGASR